MRLAKVEPALKILNGKETASGICFPLALIKQTIYNGKSVRKSGV